MSLLEEITTTDDAELRQEPIASTSRSFLFVVLHRNRLHDGGARYLLSNLDCVIIGRGETRSASSRAVARMRTLDLRLPSTAISRSHAHLVFNGGGWHLEDAGSRNGCFLNGQRVQHAPLNDGDLIEIGPAFLRYRSALPVSPLSATHFDSLSYSPKAPGFLTLLPSLADSQRELARIANTPISVLLLGETGTGKEVLASSIHTLSGRSGPFVAINCGALTSTLLESQLFGHAKGAFTGAIRDEPGYILSANGGTLFLDEVGDLSLQAQAALLRVLQEQKVVPIGETRPKPVDIRIIAATHKPLEQRCATGEFRSDLLARLSGYVHTLSPLRERPEDMGLLIRDILCRSVPSKGKGMRLSTEVCRKLLAHNWPLNIRELEHTLMVAAALAEDDTVELSHLHDSLARTQAPAPKAGRRNPSDIREDLQSLLNRHHGNISEVARTLGKTRTQIHRWMKKFGINPEEYRSQC